MKISILCSSLEHPVNTMLSAWIDRHKGNHDIVMCRSRAELAGGDLLFLVSCSEFIPATVRDKFHRCLTIHASDLPRGRGWSPHVWELVNGASEITVSMINAEDEIDSGDVWMKISVSIPDNILYEEINHLLFTAESQLMDYAVASFTTAKPIPQDITVAPTYYPRRKPTDSEIDPYASIAGQFDLLRVCDPERYPAYFQLRGHKYKIILEKLKND